MILKVLTGFVLGLLLTTAPTLAQEAEEVPGTALYRQRCANCHQVSGAPVDAIQRMMGVPMRHLGSADVQAKSDEELSQNVVDGTGKMVATRNVSDQQVSDLVRYMRSLKEP